MSRHQDKANDAGTTGEDDDDGSYFFPNPVPVELDPDPELGVGMSGSTEDKASWIAGKTRNRCTRSPVPTHPIDAKAAPRATSLCPAPV